MKRNLAISFVVALVLVALSWYAALSAPAGRPLTVAELGTFSNAISRAALLHGSENGGPRAIMLARSSLTTPVVEDQIVVGGQGYTVPLPPYTTHDPDDPAAFVTFADGPQLDHYLSQTLPAAG